VRGDIRATEAAQAELRPRPLGQTHHAEILDQGDRGMNHCQQSGIDVNVLNERPINLDRIEGLARCGHQSLAADVFIAGLLHNISVIVQIRLDPSGVMGMINARRRDGTRAIRSLESQHTTVGHEQCGALVLDAWRLPMSLVSAVQHHHDPMEAPQEHRNLTALVNLGANVALACGNTYALEPAPSGHNVSAMTCLGVTVEDLKLAAANLRDRVDQLCEL
jgi:hypothetical protein